MQLKIKSLGQDDFGRHTYQNLDNGNIYAIVNGKFYSTTAQGEPECSLKSEFTFKVVQQSPLATQGELLAFLLTGEHGMVYVYSEEEAVSLVKVAKFHDVKVLYCFKRIIRPHPVNEHDATSTRHIVANHKTAQQLVHQENFVCVGLNTPVTE